MGQKICVDLGRHKDGLKSHQSPLLVTKCLNPFPVFRERPPTFGAVWDTKPVLCSNQKQPTLSSPRSQKPACDQLTASTRGSEACAPACGGGGSATRPGPCRCAGSGAGVQDQPVGGTVYDTSVLPGTALGHELFLGAQSRPGSLSSWGASEHDVQCLGKRLFI